MQTIPTSTVTTKLADTQTYNMHSPSLFRPYNHFPSVSVTSSLSPSLNGLGMQGDEPYKSAFQRVERRPVNSNDLCLASMSVYQTEPHYYNGLSNQKFETIPSSNCYNYGFNPISTPLKPLAFRDFRTVPVSEVTKITPNFETTSKTVEMKSDDMPMQQSSNPMSEFSLEQMIKTFENIKKMPQPVPECEKTQKTNTEEKNNGRSTRIIKKVA